MSSSTSIASFTGCGLRGTTIQPLTRLLVSFIGRLVEIRAGIIVYSVETFQLATPCDSLASRCGRCRRIGGEAKVRVTFSSAVATSSVLKSTNVSSLRRGFTPSSQRYVVSWQLESQPDNDLWRPFWEFHRVCTEYVALTRRCRRYHLACKTRGSFAASADSSFLQHLFDELCRNQAISPREESEKLRRRTTKTKEAVVVNFALSVPLTLFNLCLLLNSHCRPYVHCRRLVAQVICS